MNFIKLIITATSLLLSSLAFAVDINTADAPALAAEINGVGAKRAEAIIAYRQQNGPFKSVDELQQVRGISTKILERNRANLSVGG